MTGERAVTLHRTRGGGPGGGGGAGARSEALGGVVHASAEARGGEQLGHVGHGGRGAVVAQQVLQPHGRQELQRLLWSRVAAPDHCLVSLEGEQGVTYNNNMAQGSQTILCLTYDNIFLKMFCKFIEKP